MPVTVAVDSPDSSVHTTGPAECSPALPSTSPAPPFCNKSIHRDDFALNCSYLWICHQAESALREARMQFCVNCGRPYEASDSFCNSCGKPVPVIINRIPEATTPKPESFS